MPFYQTVGGHLFSFLFFFAKNEARELFYKTFEHALILLFATLLRRGAQRSIPGVREWLYAGKSRLCA